MKSRPYFSTGNKLIFLFWPASLCISLELLTRPFPRKPRTIGIYGMSESTHLICSQISEHFWFPRDIQRKSRHDGTAFRYNRTTFLYNRTGFGYLRCLWQETKPALSGFSRHFLVSTDGCNSLILVPSLAFIMHLPPCGTSWNDNVGFALVDTYCVRPNNKYQIAQLFSHLFLI